MYTLYHNPASTCSQKVRWVFAEKSATFATKEIDLLAGDQHQDWYKAINPNGVVPALVHDGVTLLESTLIIRYIDDAVSGASLMPDDAMGRYLVNHWLHRVDAAIHPQAATLTFALGPRKLINLMPDEQREANIENIIDPVSRARRRNVLDHGIEAPEFKDALHTFLTMLDDVEEQLETSDWLGGNSVSLAEAAVLPYVLRVFDLGLDPLIEARPNVSNWFARLQARPSYDVSITKWVPAEIQALMRANGEEEWPAIKAMLAGD